MVARKIFIIDFGIFSWVNPYELSSALIFGDSLVNYVSVFEETRLRQTFAQVAVILRVFLSQSINQAFNLRVLHEIGYENLCVSRFGQRN